MDRKITPTSVPSATYRLQFHRHFNFARARKLVPYLAELGVSHVYASPIFRATPGSMHGYDVCDHNALNPDLGSRADFEAMAGEMQKHGISLVLDFVPNHMGIEEAMNTWWMDVLENGQSSPYARFFDIDWEPTKRELEGKVLLPILGDQYGRVLERGELKLTFEQGAFHLEYFGRRLPIAPRTILPLLQGVSDKLREREIEPPAELCSIMFTLEHLPGRADTEPARMVDRAREKEIARARLEKLSQSDPVVHRAIQSVIEEIQSGGAARNFDAFDALISAQPYRLAYWRVAGEEINYRRFFDINNLAAIRMELPEVFDATHRLVIELLASGLVTGLRIDHVDGLWDPRAYLRKLQERYAEIRGVSPEEKPLYLLVEKILGRGEHLRADWPVHGTTGYEAGAQICAVLVDPEPEEAFTELYSKFLDQRLLYPDIVHSAKLLVMRVSMASEVNVLGHMLERISETNRWYRDFTLNALTAVIREVIACFPVYRTYITPDGHVADEDRRVILRAIALARRRNPAIERTIFEFLRDVLMPPSDAPHPVDEVERIQFVMKFQQCTGPITAKGVEDTAFYIYNRLVALNEVGGEPDVFGSTPELFHQQNMERLARFSDSMVSTSTHDTKRSEDARARLAALSEIPQEWARAIRRWSTLNAKHRVDIEAMVAPDKNEEYLLYQTLLASWPLQPMTQAEREIHVKRVQEYMLKALHEAKVHTSWTEPNETWDQAVEGFVAKILADDRKFLPEFEVMARRVAELGMINSLAQVVLKFTIPGVPDLYQGQEMWDFSLVDPDNRRPVDFETRIAETWRLRDETPNPVELLRNWRDGRLKLFLTLKLLHFRREHRALFRHGTYTPVAMEGKYADSCVAFTRQHEGEAVLVVVPRLAARVGTPPIGKAWKDTAIASPVAVARGENLFTGKTLEGPLLREIFRELPVAVFRIAAG